MKTLAEQRAEIAKSIRDGRTATSEASRRAIGEAIVKRRTGKAEVEDINAVVQQQRTKAQLPVLDQRGGVPAQRGKGSYDASKNNTAGIASPLTEPAASTREYYDPALLPTTDGLAWVRWRSVKKIVMQDANDAEVVLEFANGVSE